LETCLLLTICHVLTKMSLKWHLNYLKWNFYINNQINISSCIIAFKIWYDAVNIVVELYVVIQTEKKNGICGKWTRPVGASRQCRYLGGVFSAAVCDECIERLEERSRAKRSRLSIGNRQSLVAGIARLESAKTRLQRRFLHFGGDYTDTNSSSSDAQRLIWWELDTAFQNRILTGVVINADYIEPRQFLEDAGCVVLEQVRDVIERHNSVKVNTMFNGEFVTGDKRANKSIITRNYELFCSSDLQEWYQSRVVEPTLTSLVEYQERDSGVIAYTQKLLLRNIYF